MDVTGLDLPEVNEGLYLITLLFDVGPAEPGPMGGARRLSWAEIGEWNRSMELGLHPWELGVVRTLSEVYCATYNSACSELNVPPPYIPDSEVMLETQRAKVHDFFDMLETPESVKRKRGRR